MSTLLIDSHAHVDFEYFQDQMPRLLENMTTHHVAMALCPGVNLEDFDRLHALVMQYPQFYGAVAVHPGYDDVIEPSVDDIVKRAMLPKIIAIGETGLDYHYHQGDMTWQQNRFRNHIRAAIIAKKPLMIHCRDAAEDVIRILREENAQEVGGVMHCFSEKETTAKAALDLGFYISFSGIITFKNAQAMKEVAKSIPLDRLLIETDAPYLAPAPYRGKMNEPAFVSYVAQTLADVLGLPIETIAKQTTENFCRLFNVPFPSLMVS